MAQVHPRGSVNRSVPASHSFHSELSKRKVPHFSKLFSSRELAPVSPTSALGDDREDLSDDEDDDIRRGRKCSGKLVKVLKAVFPDVQPFVWMILPFIVLLIMYLIDLGSDDSPRLTNLVVSDFSEEIARRAQFELSDSSPAPSTTMPFNEFRDGGYLLFALWACSNIIIWLFFMSVRAILIILLKNAVPQEGQILSAVLMTVDPQVVYVAWSLFTFGFWNATFRQSVYLWDRRQFSGGTEPLYYSLLFRRNLLMSHRLFSVSSALWSATILLALRQLLFRALVFRFELSFMANTNGELVSYLTRYSLLKRFNTRWNAYRASQESKKKLYSSWRTGSRTPPVPDLGEKYSDSAVSRTRQRVASYSNNTQQWMPKPLPKVNSPEKFDGDPFEGSIFRFRRYLSRQAYGREHHGHGFPKQLKQSSIEKSTRSHLYNWMLIQYVLHFPPTFFLQGKQIELVSKALTRTFAENVFFSLMVYAKSATHQEVFEGATGHDNAMQTKLQEKKEIPISHSDLSGQATGDRNSGSTIPAVLPPPALQPEPLERALQSAVKEEKSLIDLSRRKIDTGAPSALGSRAVQDNQSSDQEQKSVSGLMSTVAPHPATRAEDVATTNPIFMFKNDEMHQQTPQPQEVGADEPCRLLSSGVTHAMLGNWYTGIAPSVTQTTTPLQKLQENRSVPCNLTRQERAVPTTLNYPTKTHSSHLIIQRSPINTIGIETLSCTSGQSSGQQMSRSTSLEQGIEEVQTTVPQPHLLPSPMLGALDYSVNSRLLANLGPGDFWCGEHESALIQAGSDELAGRHFGLRKGQIKTSRGASRDTEYFDRSFVEQFLKPEETEEFMQIVDLGGHGKISKSMFVRAFVSMYKFRSSLIKSMENQASICKTVRQMISLLLWAVTLVALLLVLGVNLNTVLVTGAATLSALLVALSYLYEQFVTAVIFVALTNPYNIGDRVVVEGGRVLFVKRIRTYTTEFNDIYGSLVVLSNSILWGQQIVNESRSRNASLEFKLQVGFRTSLHELRRLETRVKQALAARPLDFVKDSFSIFLEDVQPGRWISVAIWMTTVESWTNWPKILRLRTELSMMIHNYVMELGIWYEEPKRPVQLRASRPERKACGFQYGN